MMPQASQRGFLVEQRLVFVEKTTSGSDSLATNGEDFPGSQKNDQDEEAQNGQPGGGVDPEEVPLVRAQFPVGCLVFVGQLLRRDLELEDGDSQQDGQDYQQQAAEQPTRRLPARRAPFPLGQGGALAQRPHLATGEEGRETEQAQDEKQAEEELPPAHGTNPMETLLPPGDPRFLGRVNGWRPL
jgi:hypothetical protein